MQVVYVLHKDGTPLMPTKRFGKVRYLLKNKLAKVVKRNPFTIQLNYESKSYVQDITLGVDAGSRHIGLSASTKKKELYCSDVELRNDIVGLISTRSALRRTRRKRLRYRPRRFNNRTNAKKKGWLAPSVKQKINSHLKVIENAHEILPINNLRIELASFDTQLLKAKETGEVIEGKDYQHGEQFGFWNIREYVLFRDNHECQCCHGKSKDKVLEVHHLESRKTGGNAPNNLITLCRTCHEKYHRGEIELKQKRGTSYKDTTFMNIMKNSLYNQLKEIYPNVEITYGYITKANRIKYGLAKEHYNDAYCIAGNFEAEPLDTVIYQRKIRCHNRQIHQMTINKGGYRKRNQLEYKVFGFRALDKVKCNDKVGFIFARRSNGQFKIKTFNRDLIHECVSYKKLEFLEVRNSYIKEERIRQYCLG